MLLEDRGRALQNRFKLRDPAENQIILKTEPEDDSTQSEAIDRSSVSYRKNDSKSRIRSYI